MRKHLLSAERAVALAVILIRTAVCVYRAATQSFTYDESLTYRLFVAGSWRGLYFHSDTNNQMLLSMLSKLSVSLFGDSEFAIRLPSLIAGFMLMLGLWAILERLDSRAIRWVAFAAIAVHPLILDLSIAARGYSLAVALLAWAFYALTVERYSIAGILLGLAVSANLTAAFPALGLVAASFFLAEGSWPRRLRTLIATALPAGAVVLIVLGGALLTLRPANIARLGYIGFPTIRESLFNLIIVSILSGPRAGLFGTRTAAYILEFVMLPAIALLIATASIVSWRRGDRKSLLAPLALSIAVAGIIGARYLIAFPYPVDRIGVPLMFLFGIAWAAAAAQMPNRLLRGASLIGGGLLVIQFATQFHVTFFNIWFYDRSTKEIAHRIEKEIRGKPPGSVSIGADWMYQSALEYYRIHDRVTALQPVALRTGAEVYDFNVLSQTCGLPAPRGNKNLAGPYGNAVLFSDPFARVILAEGAQPPHPAFFTGESALGYDIYYLQFPGNGNLFGTYNCQSFPWLYHDDLGFEFFTDVNDGKGGANFYDSASGHTFYTNSSQFPYLYDFTFGAWLYYFPDATKPGHYTANPRRFVNMSTKKIFTM